jgi:plasmid stability protein
MTTLTVHNLDDAMEKQLQIKAKQHNCSTEEEVYRILKKALFPKDKQKNLGSRLHEQIMEITNGIEFELELPVRSLPRTAPKFENTK